MLIFEGGPLSNIYGVDSILHLRALLDLWSILY